MEKLYKTIMADPSKDFAVLQKKYGPQSEALIRTAVQKIYLLGADYATKTQDTTAFITQQDLANVKKQVDVTYVAFWKRVYDEVHRKDIIIPTEPEEAKPVDPAVEAALISTVTATTTLALSTLSKLDQLGGDAQTKKLVWITEQDDRVCQICQPLHGQEFEQDDPTMPIPGPDSTHFRCRCRLLVKEGDDILL